MIIDFGTGWPNFFVLSYGQQDIYEQSLHCNIIFLLDHLKLISAETLKLKWDAREYQISPKKLEGSGVLLNTSKDALVLYGSHIKIVPWDIKYWREIPFCYEMWKLILEFTHISSWTAELLKMGLTSCPKMSVTTSLHCVTSQKRKDL